MRDDAIADTRLENVNARFVTEGATAPTPVLMSFHEASNSAKGMPRSLEENSSNMSRARECSYQAQICTHMEARCLVGQGIVFSQKPVTQQEFSIVGATTAGVSQPTSVERCCTGRSARRPCGLRVKCGPPLQALAASNSCPEYPQLDHSTLRKFGV